MNLDTCKKKTADGNVYNTLGEANTAAKKMENNFFSFERVRGFPCKYCSKFHIGGQTPRRDREPRVWSF